MQVKGMELGKEQWGSKLLENQKGGQLARDGDGSGGVVVTWKGRVAGC